LGDTSAADEKAIQNEIAGQNSAIADLLGITTSGSGDLTTVPIIDITDDAAVTGASTNELRYASLGPAIVGAAQADAGSDVSIEAALNAFVEANDEGALTGKTDGASSTTDLFEINTAVAAVLETVDDETTGTIENLETAKEQNDTQIEEAEEAGDTEVTGTVSDGAFADPLGKAKIAVGQVRELARGTAVSIVGADLVDATTAFGDEISMAGDIAKTDHVLEAIGLAIAAISDQVDNEETEPAVTDDADAVVAVTKSGTTYTVDQNITVETVADDASIDSQVVAVKLVAVATETFVESETVDPNDASITDFEGNGGLDILITEGTASNTSADGKTVLTINTGILKGELDATEHDEDFDQWSSTDESAHSTEYMKVTGVDGQLDITLSHDSTRFEGALTVKLDSVVVDSDEQVVHDVDDGQGNTVDTYDNSSEVTLGLATIGLDGQFTNGVDEFNAKLTIEVDGKGNTYTDQCDETVTNHQGWDAVKVCTNLHDNETASNMVGAEFSLALETKLDGIADADNAKVTVDVVRTGLESGTATLVAKYSGVELTSVLTVSDSINDKRTFDLSITNLDNVVMAWSQTCNEETEVCTLASQGSVTLDGKQYGTLTKDGSLYKVTYTDGISESLQ